MNKTDQRFRTKETHTPTHTHPPPKKEEKILSYKDSVQEETTMEVDLEKKNKEKKLRKQENSSEKD